MGFWKTLSGNLRAARMTEEQKTKTEYCMEFKVGSEWMPFGMPQSTFEYAFSMLADEFRVNNEWIRRVRVVTRKYILIEESYTVYK